MDKGGNKGSTLIITLAKYKKRQWLKSLSLSLIFLACLYFLDRHIHWAKTDPKALRDTIVYCAVMGAIGCVILLIKRFRTPEHERAENRLEEEGDDLILKAFGRKAFARLHSDDDNRIILHAIDVCSEMLASEAAKASPDLQFFLLVKLARYYAKDGQPSRAKGSLETALSMRPTSLVPNLRIATLLETMGKGDEAVTHYEMAQQDNALSAKLKDYLSAQTQRVKTEGPRQKGPFDDTGLRWIWGA